MRRLKPHLSLISKAMVVGILFVFVIPMAGIIIFVPGLPHLSLFITMLSIFAGWPLLTWLWHTQDRNSRWSP